MALVNMPIPLPLVVLVGKAIVGFTVVLQQIPRAVMAAPPSAVTLPPLAAVVVVIAVIVVVVTVGNAVVDVVVVKLISLP